jgi:integrase
MGRRAKVSLYRLFTVDGKHRYVPIVRKGRSWAPKIEPTGTIAKATAVIPNTLVLTRADFPRVNKNVKDYYPRSVVDAMFAACKNLRELVMLALFYYTGCREDEVAHLRWTDFRWEAKEFFIREWWKDNWTG